MQAEDEWNSGESRSTKAVHYLGKEEQMKETHKKEESTPADLKKPDAANKEEEIKAKCGDGLVEVKSEETPGDEKNGTKPKNATKTEEGKDIEVNNPKQPTPTTTNTANTSNKRPMLMSAYLLGRMGARRFVPLDHPDLLNYKGVELLLVAAYDVLLDSKVDAELVTSSYWSAKAPYFMEIDVILKDHAKLIRPLFEGT